VRQIAFSKSVQHLTLQLILGKKLVHSVETIENEKELIDDEDGFGCLFVLCFFLFFFVLLHGMKSYHQHKKKSYVRGRKKQHDGRQAHH
jgi:hypothetical protein